jgi:glycerophosphoryl diester phosphodiesterase
VTAIFAHRGCRGVPGTRENTVEAFAAARRVGADGVELDVRATADGALAVHHDRHVPGVGDVTNVSAAELPGDVPLLGAALQGCAGLRVNVEIKGGPPEADLVARLLLGRRDGTGAHPADVFVSSFDAAGARGVGLHVWTVNADADLAAMGALGVDAVITDRVAAAIGILRAGDVPGSAGNGEDRAG